MPERLVLASGSTIRATLLRNAGVSFAVEVARIDEDTARRSLQAEKASPREIADTLAEMKAQRIASRDPGALVIGCDQVLAFKGRILSKPMDAGQAIADLSAMRGATHHLFSAVVVYADGVPVWRHLAEVRLTMHDLSDAFLARYVAENWTNIRDAVGGYKIEEAGVRLFSAIEGDYFAVLGLPLIQLLSYLARRGTLPS
jgi:septum formation protein